MAKWKRLARSDARRDVRARSRRSVSDRASRFHFAIRSGVSARPVWHDRRIAAERKRAFHCSLIFNRGFAVARIAPMLARQMTIANGAKGGLLGLELAELRGAAWSAYRPGDPMSHSDRLRDWRLPRWAPIGFPAGVLPGRAGAVDYELPEDSPDDSPASSISGGLSAALPIGARNIKTILEAARCSSSHEWLPQCCRQSRPESPSCRRSLFPRSHWNEIFLVPGHATRGATCLARNLTRVFC